MRDPAYDIIGAAIRIHRQLGPWLLESAYEACLAYELQRLGKRVERQRRVPVFWEDVKLDCGFRADLVVDGKIVVELKCKDALHQVDEAQLLSHMRLLNIPLGLLINFHVVLLRDGIKRMVNNYAPVQEETGLDAAQRSPVPIERAGERSIFATFATFAVHVFKHLTAKDAKIAKK
jgi:GxxExxY protein